MKLKFDSNLDFQLEAIGSATDLFEGLPPKQSDFEINLSYTLGSMGITQTELGIGNRLCRATGNRLNSMIRLGARRRDCWDRTRVSPKNQPASVCLAVAYSRLGGPILGGCGFGCEARAIHSHKYT